MAEIQALSTNPDDYLSDCSEESEKEDDLMKDEDNLVLVGRFDGDATVLEVHGNNVKITIIPFVETHS